MKILTFSQFLALPPNVVFSKYIPNAFGELSIKSDSLAKDFWTTSLPRAVKAETVDEFKKLLADAQKSGASVPMDFTTTHKDGMSTSSQLYAVWEDADVQKLIERLQRCIAGIPRRDEYGWKVKHLHDAWPSWDLEVAEAKRRGYALVPPDCVVTGSKEPPPEQFFVMRPFGIDLWCCKAVRRTLASKYEYPIYKLAKS